MEEKLATPLKHTLMPSPETSRENLKKAKASWRQPRPWRSRAESRLIRSFAWHWHLGRGPSCSGRALARWLGVSHTYIQKLARTLSTDENDFLREIRYSGVPTIDGLGRAREESRQMRERGLLRRQCGWKTVQPRIGNTTERDFIATEPHAASPVANNSALSDVPAPTKSAKAHPDYNAIHMWHLRMNAAQATTTRTWILPRRMRWRPGRLCPIR
jgi:hypothetical protein